MKQKCITTVIMALTMIGVLAGCSGSAATQTPSSAASSAMSSETSSLSNGVRARQKQFIFVCPIQENEYWEDCIEGINQASKELGINTEIVGPKTADNFSEEIIVHMEEAIEARPNGILAYCGIEDMKPLIDRAAGVGIPVIALDSDAPDTARVAYVGSDTYNLGSRAGKAMVDLTGGTAKIGVLVSSTSADKEMEVLRAFQNVIMDYDMEIVAIDETDADPDVSEKKSRKMLEQYPEITAFFCTAGYNVTGVARTKKELGLDDIVLVGFDDVPENLEFVREGVIDTILVQSPENMGYSGVYLLDEYLINGKLSIDSYDTGSVLVTKDNVDSYGLPASTVEGKGRIVRIGYYEDDERFQDGFSDEERKSGYAYDFYQEIAKVANWQYEYVYGTRDEVMRMLSSGDVDIVAGVYQTDKREKNLLFSGQDMGLDGTPCYFAVSQKNPDLLEELDSSINQLLTDNPSLLTDLKKKYYSQTQIKVFNTKEWQWINEQDELRVGYVKHNLPYSDQGIDKKPTGLVSDLIDYIESFTQISVKSVCYETIQDMQNGLSNGEIDAAFPVYYDRWQAEQRGFRLTDPFISDRVMIIYNGEYTSDLMKRVALSDTGIGQKYYFEEHYPDSEVTFYSTRNEALDAVLSGDERCLVGSSSVLQLFIRRNPQYNKLSISYLDSTEEFGMAVDAQNNILAGILDKVLYHMDDATVAGLRMKYTGTSTKLTTEQFLQYYFKELLAIFGFFILLLLGMFISYVRREKVFRAQQQQSHVALENALDVANQANKSKTLFLSSMSHDIRTPMNAITGMTAIALQHVGSNKKVEDCLNKIALSSRHLLTLINDVLDISKIESGKMTLNPVNFSLRETVALLLNVVRPMAKAKKQTLDIQASDLPYDTVYADEVRLNQVYVNLLTNAVKYTHDGGRIEVLLSEEMQEDGKIRLTYVVQDNGIGMSPEFMENMYEVFSRVEDTRTAKIQGTGLGLAIVKRVVDLLDGTLECESHEGEGTKFTVTVDVGYVDSSEQYSETCVDESFDAEAESDENAFQGLRVLVAEDYDLNWDVITELLDMYGIKSERAENGEQCLEMLRASEPGYYALVLMDIQMPVMDGREATRHIRKEEREDLRDIPVIAMTADAFADDVAASMEAGMNGHVAKPVDMNRLLQEIRRFVPDGGGRTRAENTQDTT